MNPVCSVIIPCYNAENYLEEAIRSVCGQTIQNIEIIILDDASTDSSLQIVERLQKGDGRIALIAFDKNQGVCAARNIGVIQAKGEWIAFLDSDDVWMPEKLALQLQAVKERQAALCCTGAFFFGGRKDEKYIEVPESITAERLLKGNVVITSSVLVKRTALMKYPMERPELHEDLICWYRVLSAYGPAVGINKPLLRYRLTQGSKSRNKLHSAMTTWKTQQYMGVRLVARVGNFIGYVWHGIRRYG